MSKAQWQIGREPAKHTNGGFRAGKRKRGNSLLKRKPRASTVVTTYRVVDEDGHTLAHIKTLTYKRSSL